MKNIAVLVDFSEGSSHAINQASSFVTKTEAKLWGVHIVDSKDKVSAAQEELSTLMKLHCEVDHDIVVEVGNLFSAVPKALKSIQADLVVIYTHGVKGIYQQLFGAQILKLAQKINVPAIIFGNSVEVNVLGTQKILFPMSNHRDFEKKIKQTAELATLLNAEVVLYEIDIPNMENSEGISKNREHSIAYFNSKNIPFKSVVEDLKVWSAGYYKQTIEFAVSNKINIICLMAKLSKDNVLFDARDKENFLVNDRGVIIYAIG